MSAFLEHRTRPITRLAVQYSIRVFTLLIAFMCATDLVVAVEFEKVVLDKNIGKVCYAVTAADVDGDSKLDAVAISEREAIWYRNGDWTRHVMISDAVPSDHVCIAAGDIDRDGAVDFALGAGWPTNGGSIHWLRRAGAVTDSWQVHEIGSESWTHRMRFADVLGRGQEQLVVTPLNRTVGTGIRLLAFPIPPDPVNDPWQPVVIDGSLNRAHNHWHLKSETGPDNTIVASQEGLTLFVDPSAAPTTFVTGASGDKPTAKGCGEVKTGRLNDKLLLATIEPMHGNQVVVYVGDDKIGPGMKRVVLDDTFSQGHAIWCADLDGDGMDEVIAAHREPAGDQAPGIYIYRAQDAAGESWDRELLDRPMACEDIWCADFNADGKIDILAGGRATHDVNLYLNQ